MATSPETPFRVRCDALCVKYRLLYVLHRHRRDTFLSCMRAVSLCIVSISESASHVFANDFAGFGVQIISANDEHVATVAEREHRFVREANADVADSV